MARADEMEMDAQEEIAEYRELGWGALARAARNLNRLPKEWYDRGRYRAVAHHLVCELRFTDRDSRTGL